LTDFETVSEDDAPRGDLHDDEDIGYGERGGGLAEEVAGPQLRGVVAHERAPGLVTAWRAASRPHVGADGRDRLFADYGVESDPGEVRVADVAELLRYCYRIAGTVALMRTAALDVTVPEPLPHAIDLGVAMQLTNICRDVREDALRGRRYLPATLGGVLEPAALIDPACAARAAAVHAVRTLLDLADRHHTSGEQGLRYLPCGARAGILVAARVYRKIGVVLRRRDGDCGLVRSRA
jgi:hypothetical protein